MAELLLHSLSEFESILFPLLDILHVQTTVEVGVEYGHFSKKLIERARNIGAIHIGIDPSSNKEATALFDNINGFLVNKTSIEALEKLEVRDAYFLDGDHNYYTVFSELNLIDAAAKKSKALFPLVVLHDIGWPWGRRDLYYNPSALPGNAVHSFSFDHGVTPSSPNPIKGGFRSHGKFAFALREGGPKNGVRTAIEDFLEERSDLIFYDIPAVFGLGIIISKENAKIIDQLIKPYHLSPLLVKLERNRLELYLKVIELQDYISSFQLDSSVKGTS